MAATTTRAAARTSAETERVPLLRSTIARHLSFGVAVLAAVVALSLALDPYRNLQLTAVAYMFCAAAGLSVLTGLSGQISLGQGAFMAVGAYVTALFLLHPPLPEGNVLLAVALVSAVLVTALVGALVGAAAARLRGPYLAGATLAFAVGLPALVNYRHLVEWLGGENGLAVISPPPPETLGETGTLDRWQLWVCTLGAVLVTVLLANLARGRAGRSWRAVRDDEVAAELSGLSVARLQIGAFVTSAACAGLGGALLAFTTGLAAPGAFLPTLSLQLLAAVVLGGLGTLSGAFYGSLVIVFLPTWSANVANSLSLPREVYANLPLAVYGVVLVLVMLLFPWGLAGGIARLRRRFSRSGQG